MFEIRSKLKNNIKRVRKRGNVRKCERQIKYKLVVERERERERERENPMLLLVRIVDLRW